MTAYSLVKTSRLIAEREAEAPVFSECSVVEVRPSDSSWGTEGAKQDRIGLKIAEMKSPSAPRLSLYCPETPSSAAC